MSLKVCLTALVPTGQMPDMCSRISDSSVLMHGGRIMSLIKSVAHAGQITEYAGASSGRMLNKVLMSFRQIPVV